jgi:hypothetical protein
VKQDAGHSAINLAEELYLQGSKPNIVQVQGPWRSTTPSPKICCGGHQAPAESRQALPLRQQRSWAVLKLLPRQPDSIMLTCSAATLNGKHK